MRKFKSVVFCLSMLPLYLCNVGLFAQNFDVSDYEINLDVDHLQPNRHIGYTKLTLRMLSSEDVSVQLDLRNQFVDSVLVNGRTVAFDYDGNKILFLLPQPALPNEDVEVRVYYNGGDNVEPYGWGGVHYTNDIIYNLGVAFGDFPHAYGRAWFACKDSFTDKARFRFDITVNKDVKAVCGGVLDSVSRGENSDTYHWTLNREIPTYLASMAVADFAVMERNLQSLNGNVPLQVFYFSSDSAAVYRNFEKFDSAFANMERLFGAFPFERVGYCTTPQGSMEHVDNIAFVRSLASSFSLSSQSVMVHEFAHSWFGNLITCESAGDMWINEGWTTFTERLSLEAMHGSEYAKEHFRQKAEEVIAKLPYREGVFALSGVDSSRTYSSTVYDKGALVAMSLKTYMGDSLFYSSVRKLLNDFAYSNINSHTLRDSLSSYSGIDLTDFFDYYVFDTITHHFAISEAGFGNNSAEIRIRSRSAGDENAVCGNARLPITFMSSDYRLCKRTIEDDGTQKRHTFSLPFTPVAAFLDMDEEFFDLTTDSYKKIGERGLYEFKNSYSRVFVYSCTDSLLVRSTLHWVGENANVGKHGVDRFSDKHYWTIEGVNTENAEAEARFYYEVAGSDIPFDASLLTSYASLDSLMLFYRPDMGSEWEYVETAEPSSGRGYISTPLRKGDYIMAIGDKSVVGLAEPDSGEQSGIKVYPQPATGCLNVEFPRAEQDFVISVFDTLGRKLFSEKGKKGVDRMRFNFSLPSGGYVLDLRLGERSIRQNFVVK